MTPQPSLRALQDVPLPPFPSAWLGHVPFAGWLIEHMRPRVFVELGTHYGHSYFTVCHAVVAHGLETNCYAVDTWQGDDHAGVYDDQVYNSVEQTNAGQFSSFSRLLRMTFDDALNYFGDGSVDLLHIDGLHTFEAVSHDFSSWLPKLSARAVVLLHDINVRERGFGVWRLWEELRTRYPSIEFAHSSGLGVLLIGAEQPEALLKLAQNWSESSVSAYARALFARLGRTVELQSQLDTTQAELGAALARAGQVDAEDMLATLTRRARSAEQKLVASAEQLAVCTNRAQVAKQKLQASDEQVMAWATRAHAAEQRLQVSGEQLAAAHWDLQSLRASNSWRMTSPWRWVGRQLHRARTVSQLLPAAARLAGGLPRLLRLGARTLMREGLPGVKQRVRYLASRATAVAADTPQVTTAQSLGWRPRSAVVTPHTASVDIVVCVHNALDDVRRCLHAVVSSTRPPYRLIVVDDGSQPETADFLIAFMEGQPGTLIRHETAKGYTLAANAGMRATAAEFVVLLNSDTIVSPLWLDRLVECAASDSRIGLVGPLSNTASWQSVPELFDANGDWADNALPDGISVDDRAWHVAAASLRTYPRVGFLNGFCLLVRRGLIQDIGIFDEERFGRGFGEENDYCLRAAAAGWSLAVADDAYVYHAQSRSYSHERRLELVKHADVALRTAHSDEAIRTGLLATKGSRVLAAVRARIQVSADRMAMRESTRSRFEGRRVLFVLPVAAAGGGANVVIEESRALAAAGVMAVIANLRSFQPSFEASYPGLDVPVLYLDSPEDLRHHALSFDAIVATLFLTVDWIERTVGQLSKRPALFYYIQDFEPSFFPPGHADYKRALASYRTPGFRKFTKTAWNAGAVQAAVGSPVAQIGASYGWDRFVPAERAAHATPVVVAAMVRPSTPRRAPETTITVLEQLAAIFGERVAIQVFGVEPDHALLAGLHATGRCTFHGEATQDGVSAILRQSDIFLDCSTSQAMGLTAMEAMACGAAVVGPMNGGMGEIVEHERSGLLVDTLSIEDCLAATRRLIEDWEFRDRVVRAALERIAGFYPDRCAAAMAEILFANQEHLQ